jgi:hypothetical protein
LSDHPPAPMSKRMALLRMLLGMGQMTGAATAAILLISTGVNRVTMLVAIATTCMMGISLLLFRGR